MTLNSEEGLPQQDLVEIIGDYKSFVQDTLKRATDAGVDLKDYPIDHLCFRVQTVEEYQRIKPLIQKFSKGVLENAHHGRPVTKFLLSEPLIVGNYEIPVIEMPAPKQGQVINTGLEHLEMVVGDDYERIKERYASLWSGTDDSGEFNQPMFVAFNNGHSIKFHKLPISEVIKLEGNVFTEIK